MSWRKARVLVRAWGTKRDFHYHEQPRRSWKIHISFSFNPLSQMNEGPSMLALAWDGLCRSLVKVEWGKQVKVWCFKVEVGNFPGGTVDKNLPANQRTWVQSWSGKISHAAEQLSQCATTEPMCCTYWSLCALQPMLHKTSHCNEVPRHHSED